MTISNGTGAFLNASGHAVTSGPFYLDLMNVPGIGLVPAFDAEGHCEFETHGMICGVDLAALSLR